MENRETFSFGIANVNYSEGEYTIMCYSYKMIKDYTAYRLEEDLDLDNELILENVEFDSESGCFFAYTDKPATVLEIIKGMVKHIELSYTKEELEHFLSHPCVRIKHVTE